MSPIADSPQPTESHTNVDYLLEKLTIAEIIDIQSKLKTDVERKKQELKQLVGERYRDLMEAVDTIKQMNGCAHCVLNSLVALKESQSKYLKTNRISSIQNNAIVDHQNNHMESESIKNYKKALILKIITELPLNIWSSLEKEDLLRATYDYLYGQHLCSLVRQLIPTDKIPNLFKRYETAINRFNEVIVNKCWSLSQKNFRSDSLDESANADIFSCLLLLQDITPKQLFDTVIDKRTADITECLNDCNQLKPGLQSFVNILFNTIKCVDLVFFKDNETKTKSLLYQRYNRLMKASYELPLLQQTTTSKAFLQEVTTFRINTKKTIDSIESKYISNSFKTWLSDIKTLIEPLLKQLLEPIDSVNYMCIVLNEINDNLKETQKLVDWEEYCEDLMSNYIPLMDHFVIALVIIKIKTIISQNTEKSLQTLIERIRKTFVEERRVEYKDLEVIDSIWGQSDDNLAKKALAQMPVIDEFCTDFDHSFETLLNDIKILKDFNFKLIKSHELEEIESYLVNVCQSMIERLKDFLESIEESESNDLVITLFCAHFLRQMSQTNSFLRQCFDSSSPNKQYSWSKTKDILISYSYKCYKKVLDSKIDHLLANTSGNSLTDLNQFIINSFVWQKIETTEQSEEGKAITSKIEVPLQITLFLHKCLSDLCGEVNRMSGHTVARSVAVAALTTLSRHLVRIYGSAYVSLSAKDCSANMKQTIALQLYFDLLFFKQLLGTTRDESIKTNELPQIHSLIDKTESLIDPFDLHVFFPHIQTNVAKLSKSTSVLFGLIIPDSIGLNCESTSKSSQTNEIHNIMAFNSRQKAFPLLNISSINSKVSKK